MAVFDNYWREKAEYEKNRKIEMVRVIPMDRPAFNRSVLIQNIDSIPQMGDADLLRFIDANFNNILKNVFNGGNISKHVKCFQDTRFLDAFIEIMVRRQFFNGDEIIHINTICYHYLTLPHEMRDPRVVNRMTKMSNIVNRGGIPRLLGLGLSENLANMLLIARYSDINLNTIVKRVNFIIITQPLEVMSQKMISEIFKILYNVMEDWSRVFPYFMTDVLPLYREDDQTTWWITEDISEVDSTMSLSALEILDSLPTEVIRATLVNYAEGYSIMNAGKNIRFSMRRLSDDYYRINNVIYQLDTEGIYVP